MGVRLERDVMVPMRDGVRLATDVWVPDGAPSSVLLVRVPYGKHWVSLVYCWPTGPDFLALLDAGYALAFQDCRGTSRSEGEFVALVHEADDGEDTVGWLCDQSWCDGRVGMFHGSYLGFTQWFAASRAPEGLMAIAPCMTSTDPYTGVVYSEGGAPSHSRSEFSLAMTWSAAQRALAPGSGDFDTFAALTSAMSDPTAPLTRTLLVEHCSWYPDWVEHATRDEFWRELAVIERPADVKVPALNIGGWFDLFVNDQARTFTRMRAEAGSEEARAGQRLVIGPWAHGNGQTATYCDRQFGPAAEPAAADMNGLHIGFFDRWVRGRTDALDGTAPVRIFVMGIDQWRDEPDWPLPDTTYVDYFLDSAGHANTADGDGVLRTETPWSEAVDSFTYDPTDPVPTLGGRIIRPVSLNAIGPVDQRPVEARQDVLCFTTPMLDEPIEVTGHVSLVLHVTSTARDTDFTGKLVDVFPDGRAIYLTDGILRARYRHSLVAPEPLDPSQVHELNLDLSVTSNVFLPGHRIRLEVSSSCFPYFDRNLNTGDPGNSETLDDAVVAENRVLHGPAHPSRLVLPIIRR
jgi:putative CocE/NonD family hydrolase